MFLCVVYALWLLNLLSRSKGLVDDFDVFYHSGLRLLNMENIYGEPHYINLRYFYSPLFSCLMALLQSIDLQTVKVIWFLINTTLLFRCVYVVHQHIIVKSAKPVLVFFLTMLLTAKIVLINYTYNQITIVILWTVLESYHQMKKDRLWFSLFILCVGINIKILPIVLAPYYLFASGKPIKSAAIGIVFLIFFLVIPAVFIGWEYNQMLLGEWWKTLNPASETHSVQVYEDRLLDAGAMVSKYLSDKPVHNEPSFYWVHLSDSSVFTITNTLRLALLSLAVWFATAIRRPLVGIDPALIVFSVFMTLVPLCFPHQREYSYLFYFPLLAIMMSLLSWERKKTSVLVFSLLVLLSGFMTWRDFAGRTIEDFFVFHRLITFGMLLLMVYSVFYIHRFSKRTSSNLEN